MVGKKGKVMNKKITTINDEELEQVVGGGFWSSLGDIVSKIDPVSVFFKVLLTPSKAGDGPVGEPEGGSGGLDPQTQGGAEGTGG
jgi:bacteriocin-like protein